ncbi:MAG TPA: DUF2911 domain-containing protein [Thermoanaerobaculia bacterium]|nr:DUF2911 domain-containing protein [Thermoanaerobaculia bacterium]
MNRTRLALALAFALAVFLVQSALAEVPLPQVSPAAGVMQEVGISKVRIVYHRPAVQGRKIWGGLVPYGKVWRLGANEATTIDFPHQATINGNKVPAGTYSLFVIPEPTEWTIILNKVADQWGAFSYEQKYDQLRFKAKPEANAHQEWFKADLVPLSDHSMRADLMWEKVRVPFTIEFDVDTIMWATIETAIASQHRKWTDFHNAARYAQRTNKRLDSAMIWVEEAMKLNENNYWNYELKGRILHQLGRDPEAFEAMEKARLLATGSAPQEFLDELNRTVASWKKK